MIEPVSTNPATKQTGTLMPQIAAGNTPLRPLRIALAHDWIAGVRGGEHVLEAIAQCLSRDHTLVGLFTMFDDGGMIGPATNELPRICWPLGNIPGISDRFRRWMLPAYPTAVEHLSRRLATLHQREPIDLLISTSSAAIKGLRPPHSVPHLCYCHSPARYIWSQEDAYASGNFLRGLGLRAYRSHFKAWDRATAANVTQFLANSRHTAREIERCFGRDSKVVYPPVRTEYFTHDPKVARENFWLYTGALESYKNVKLAIAAAELAKKSLLIAGTGSDANRLKSLAGLHTKFLGHVSDDELRSLYRRARLVVFPQVEDFGIVAVEAQSCGTPVVAFAQGGALDSVHDGLTGALFHEATAQSLCDAANRCEVDEVACRSNAEKFSTAAFESQLLNSIHALAPAAQ